MIGTDDESPSLAVRREISVLASQRRCRTSEWTQEIPTEWRPQTVRDKDGDFFTDAGAWEFIVELVAMGHPMREVILKNPAGKRAYVMKMQVRINEPEIYIKIRLRSGTVHGYSFHYSVYSLTGD
jgi:hypothetical protein